MLGELELDYILVRNKIRELPYSLETVALKAGVCNVFDAYTNVFHRLSEQRSVTIVAG